MTPLSLEEAAYLAMQGEGMAYFGNYIGPGWSNGKLQESVEWGDLDPQDDLDMEAYYHDSSYAHFKDDLHRAAADQVFYEGTQKINGPLAKTAGYAVKYGNNATRAAKGLLYTNYGEIQDAASYEKALKEVRDHHATDPRNLRKQREIAQAQKYGLTEAELRQQKKEKLLYDAAEDERKKWEAIDHKNQKTTKTLDDYEAKMRPIWDAAAKKRNERKSQKAKTDGMPDKTPAPTQPAKPTPGPVAVVPDVPAKIAGDVVIHDPRSFVSRLFRRKKRKKKQPLTNEELISKQADNFRRHARLKHEAEASSLKHSEKPDWTPLGYNGRIKRAISTKRIAQQQGR